jgi:DNA ligase-1
LPVAALQQRLNRKQRSQDFIRETPVVFMAYDLLELEGRDIRSESLKVRRAALEGVIDGARVAWSRQGCSGELLRQGDLFESAVVVPPPLFPLVLSPRIIADSWGEVVASKARARVQGTEGLMLKRQISPYGIGRQHGNWWKWKVDPFTCDVVLVGAEAGNGRGASQYAEYTFAVWSNGTLVPVAKASSGLSESEIEEVDAYVKKNTTGHFGPVRAVKPELVFELAFEGIAESTRHKSGVSLRSPRIARWRRDKPMAEADSLDALRTMMGSAQRFQVPQD